MPIMVTRSSMPPFEEYCEEIRKLWDSHWLTNMGTEHETLQKELEDYLSCRHAVLFTNGHLALENAIASFHFAPGSEILTTPFTFASTTHAIVRNGLVPVFCDVRADNYTLDPALLEERITERTAAILPVHVYGNFCDVDAIAKIAQKHGLKVIYDAAHAFAETYRGKSAACFGDVSMFSFHATKVFNTIEGGAVCTGDAARAEALCDMKNFGIRNAETCVYAGGNAKMNEFQAAMGICNLRHLPEEIAKRKKAAEVYYERLSGRKGIRLTPPDQDIESNYTYLPVIFEEEGAEEGILPEALLQRARQEGKFDTGKRDRIFEALKREDILARKYFYPLTNMYDCYRTTAEDPLVQTPVAAYLAAHVLTLPLYADLSREEAGKVCDVVLRNL